MSDSSSVKGFINRSTQIVCPKCGYVTRQKCAAMLQDVILICLIAKPASNPGKAENG
ncbi:YnfU family zinc-binding protein [Serratia ureilytica]